MQSKGNYENNSEDRICHGRFDDHNDDGIIGAGIIMHQGLPHAPSHDEQTTRHENSIDHREPCLDAKVGELGADIIKYGTGARLYLDEN